MHVTLCIIAPFACFGYRFHTTHSPWHRWMGMHGWIRNPYRKLHHGINARGYNVLRKIGNRFLSVIFPKLSFRWHFHPLTMFHRFWLLRFGMEHKGFSQVMSCNGNDAYRTRFQRRDAWSRARSNELSVLAFHGSHCWSNQLRYCNGFWWGLGSFNIAFNNHQNSACFWLR